MSPIFLLTVHATVGLGLFIRKDEDMVEALLDAGDAAGILATDDVYDLLRRMQDPLFHNHLIPDDVYGDVVVDEAKDVQV